MRTLLLLLLFALLALVVTRERFEATTTIKNPNSWDAAEYERIKGLVSGSTFTDSEIQDIVGGAWPLWSSATRPLTLAQLTSYVERKPEYAPRKAEVINLLKAYYIDQYQVGDTRARPEEPTPAPAPSAPQETAPTTMTSSPPGTTTGTSTGGSSSTSLGPTNLPQGNMPGQMVYGPEWKGFGEGPGPEGGDSTRARSYPSLLGPKPVASTRIDGVGVVPPSQNYQLSISGSLPSAGSLGATEESRFFPYARVANTELSVDPWRVATAFSTSSYSQKTDPVPFLADFSAFQR